MNNVDVNELAKFDQLASTWWDKSGEFKSLHDINPLRVQLVNEQVFGLMGKKVIDVGCGGGILAEAMAELGADVTGLDMVQASLDVANLHKLETGVNVNYTLSTAEDWSDQHIEQYDVVTCLEMLEHVPKPESVINACAKMVKPGGKVIFSTLNRNLKSYAMAIVAAEYILQMVPKGTHDHAKFIKPAELIRMIDKTSLLPSMMTGLHYNPFLKNYYISNSNIDVNYFVVCDKTAN